MDMIKISDAIKLRGRWMSGLQKVLFLLLQIASVVVVAFVMNNIKDGNDSLNVIFAFIGGYFLIYITFLFAAWKKRTLIAIFDLVLLAILIAAHAGAWRAIIDALVQATGGSSSSSASAGSSGSGLKFEPTNTIFGVTMIFGLVTVLFSFINLFRSNVTSKSPIYSYYVKKVNSSPAPKAEKKILNKLIKKRKYFDFIHEMDCSVNNDSYEFNDKFFIEGESKFNGSAIGLALRKVLWNLLNTVTLSIMVPWTTTWRYAYYAKHCTYSGKRVTFDGHGIQLLGRWLLWILLSIVTLGIYAFFMAIALKKWVVSHQHLEGGKGESYYDGTTFGRGIIVVYTAIFTVMTFGLGRAWGMNKKLQYDMEHTVIDGQHIGFSGTGTKLFKSLIIWGILTVFTATVYYWLRGCLNMERYRTSNSRLRDLSYKSEDDPQ